MLDTSICPRHGRLCERQTRSGGLNGRPEKLQVHVCCGTAAGMAVACRSIMSHAFQPKYVTRSTHVPEHVPPAGQSCHSGLHAFLRHAQDVCYSWWCLSALSILGRLHWIDQAALTDFILDCQVGMRCVLPFYPVVLHCIHMYPPPVLSASLA